MRLIKISFVFFLISINILFSQDGFTGNERQLKTFGSPIVKISRFDNQTIVLAGGKAGFIINNNFSVGLFGIGLASQHKINQNGTLNNFNFSYAGIFASYTILRKNVFQLEPELLIGAGSTGTSKNKFIEEQSSTIYIVEPSMNLIVNLHKNFKFNFGLSYRLTSGQDHNFYRITELNKLAFNFSAMIGIF